MSNNSTSNTEAAENLPKAVERLSCASSRVTTGNWKKKFGGCRSEWKTSTAEFCKLKEIARGGQKQQQPQFPRPRKKKVLRTEANCSKHWTRLISCRGTHVTNFKNPRVRPSFYDGNRSCEDYLAQFELVAEINE